MPLLSARSLLGASITSTDADEGQIGIVEAPLMNPKLMLFDGILFGQPHKGGDHQVYMPRECITEVHDGHLAACNYTIDKPTDARRILGLKARTLDPSVLVGLVYDFEFNDQTGTVEWFTIHQLVRRWRVPASAVVKITQDALIINNDTRVKLKITPFPSEAA